MANDRETLDEAVSRIAKKNHLVHFVQGEDGFGGEDEVDTNAGAALREMAAWTYEDIVADGKKWAGRQPTYDTVELRMFLADLEKTAAAIRKGE